MGYSSVIPGGQLAMPKATRFISLNHLKVLINFNGHPSLRSREGKGVSSWASGGLPVVIPLGAPCNAKQTLTGFIYFPSASVESKLSTGLQ